MILTEFNKKAYHSKTLNQLLMKFICYFIKKFFFFEVFTEKLQSKFYAIIKTLILDIINVKM